MVPGPKSPAWFCSLIRFSFTDSVGFPQHSHEAWVSAGVLRSDGCVSVTLPSQRCVSWGGLRASLCFSLFDHTTRTMVELRELVCVGAAGGGPQQPGPPWPAGEGGGQRCWVLLTWAPTPKSHLCRLSLQVTLRDADQTGKGSVPLATHTAGSLTAALQHRTLSVFPMSSRACDHGNCSVWTAHALGQRHHYPRCLAPPTAPHPLTSLWRGARAHAQKAPGFLGFWVNSGLRGICDMAPSAVTAGIRGADPAGDRAVRLGLGLLQMASAFAARQEGAGRAAAGGPAPARAVSPRHSAFAGHRKNLRS
ncbi:uncharacterized protein LOC134477944 [Cavia porcellus]|uniref:uncharacterized protein LOC134477944 n=1 Tax=Cavia porcellus TaxID=10141 RepID=UPI002FE312DE